eukprot:TRINITY_DN30113_c0_g1_i1.p1 TRINITY_DN30113_c0_g1~~TRINITY_DN30113_c0_g1_i1.p1  ORF type:complete len:447 (+),score=152.70 TRINITY_DN30113_c0_g1_i1:42-1382(+)
MRRAPVAWLRVAHARAQASQATASTAAAAGPDDPAAGAAEGGAATPDVGNSGLAVKAAQDKVFATAVNEKYVITTEADLEKQLAKTHEKKWDVPIQRRDGEHDELWKDWEVVEKEHSDDEILDVPEFASRLTLYLRWKVCEMRCREDKFLNTSELMRNHLTKRRRVYRNAYQSLRHKAVRDRRGFISPASAAVYEASKAQGYVTYVHARFQRDILTLFKEDSLTRTARKRAFSHRTQKTKEFWKHDEFYETRRETRIRTAKHWGKVVFFSVKLPVVFIAYRWSLMAVEHVALLGDYAVAYVKGFRPTSYSKTINEHADYDNMTPVDTLRDKIKGTKAASPISTAVPLALAVLLVWWLMITFHEFRLPYYFIPAHEREQFDEMWAAFNPKKKKDAVTGETYDWKKTLERNTHRPDFSNYTPPQPQVHGVLDKHGVDFPSAPGRPSSA